ncbi:MAG TPA: hypothetical protein VH720_12950 [Candidatus Limnocylindrales bacterium]
MTDSHVARGVAALSRAAWAVGAVAIAFGAAGLVASLDHAPSSGARPELSWAADASIRPSLEAAADELRSIDADLDRLADVGKAALVTLVARDTDELTTLIDEGAALTAKVDRAGAALQAQLAAIGATPDAAIRFGPETEARRKALADAAAETRPLTATWARIKGGAVTAIQLTGVLEAHDEAVVEAANAGRRQRYTAALQHLDAADARMIRATELETQLANSVDTATLHEWLNRSRAYDRALRHLYAALRVSAGRVTRAVREAFAEEQAARSLLPSDTKPLVIIMTDVAQGTVSDAVIAIERARGRLHDALDQLDPDGQAPPAGAPPSPTPSG